MQQPVFFVGAGPGDPELITLKARRLLDEADLVIYAGSLVNPALVEGLSAVVMSSASMTLDEIIDCMAKAWQEGKRVVRLHTGDPAFYGAIREQMERLEPLGIPYRIVPGVSSVNAVAAALESELTLPDDTQTVIVTRRGGRTPVPESESLVRLAAHRCTLMILLSVAMIDDVVRELREGGYDEATPVAVVEKASWPGEERIVRGTLLDIAGKVASAGIRKTAIIAVGKALGTGPRGRESKLYDETFAHEYRKASGEEPSGV